jgi:hypothetical protein
MISDEKGKTGKIGGKMHSKKKKNIRRRISEKWFNN